MNKQKIIKVTVVNFDGFYEDIDDCVFFINTENYSSLSFEEILDLNRTDVSNPRTYEFI